MLSNHYFKQDATHAIASLSKSKEMSVLGIPDSIMKATLKVARSRILEDGGDFSLQAASSLLDS